MAGKCFSIILSLVLLFTFASVPVSGSDIIRGTGGVVAVVCTDVSGYKEYSAHYNDHFPLGSTVKIYVEASGKTSRDLNTDEYKPSISFELAGTKPPYPPGPGFTASASSSVMTNPDKSQTKRTYAVISFTLSSEEDLEGEYRFRITAKDSNAGGRVIGRTDYITVHAKKDATLYPAVEYHYFNLTIDPNPSMVGSSATVKVNVTNLGGKGNWVNEQVYLVVDGTEVESTNAIRLDQNDEAEVTFTLNDETLGNEPGNTTIAIDDLEEVVIREEANSGSSGSSSSGSTGGNSGSNPAQTPGFEIFGAIIIILFVARSIRHL
ncbi:MAG: hypothetical protein SYNGOMJ08_00636 [Candidatus Syntrophoarchaeum sp. GoM_oil]|nr:MAG: hypothetical protein SYNGOMJ08_00636 [Candidatus Syntrophoarchaeum sp. GoM_oil]